jgi:hypothetical protein
MKNKNKLRAVVLSALMALGLIAGTTLTAGEASARIQNGCYWFHQNAMGQSSTAKATVHRGHLRINGMDAHTTHTRDGGYADVWPIRWGLGKRGNGYAGQMYAHGIPVGFVKMTPRRC